MDEAGGTTKQVNEYRNLVQRDNVDVVTGYISSGDCLAVAPLAEELKKLTVLFDCGTPRIFEDASYKYLFRTGATATMDNVAAALYVTEAWGQDSWNDFEAWDCGCFDPVGGSMSYIAPSFATTSVMKRWQWRGQVSGGSMRQFAALAVSGSRKIG